MFRYQTRAWVSTTTATRMLQRQRRPDGLPGRRHSLVGGGPAEVPREATRALGGLIAPGSRRPGGGAGDRRDVLRARPPRRQGSRQCPARSPQREPPGRSCTQRTGPADAGSAAPIPLLPKDGAGPLAAPITADELVLAHQSVPAHAQPSGSRRAASSGSRPARSGSVAA